MTKISYLTDGIQTEFPFPYRLFEDENLRVFLNEVELSTGFSISDEETETGAKLIFSIAPEAGKTLTLFRQNILKRATDFQENNPLSLTTLNYEFDYQVETLKDIFGQVDRCIHQNILDDETLDLTLPSPEAGKAIVWAETEDKFINSEINISTQLAEFQSFVDQTETLYDQIQVWLGLSGDAGVLGLVNNMIELINLYHPDAFSDFEYVKNANDSTESFGLISVPYDETITYD